MEAERKYWLDKYRYSINNGWNKHYWDKPMFGVGVRNYLLIKEKIERWGFIYVGLNKQNFSINYKQWENRCGKRFRSPTEKMDYEWKHGRVWK